MRDRLIEILKSKPYGYSSYEDFADYLLAEGVIVPPCKVGDNLFALSASGTKVYVFTVARLDIMESGILIWGKAHYTKELVAICSNYDIGDSVFLAREEAERALKGADDDKQ